MSAFAAGSGAADTWPEALEHAVAQMGALPSGANLGFVYVGAAFARDLGAITARLRRETGVADWVGTSGMGVIAGGAEHFDAPAIALMVGAFPPDAFRLFGPIIGDATEARARHGSWIDRARPLLAVAHADYRSAELPAEVAETADLLGCFLVGGLGVAEGEVPLAHGAEVTRGPDYGGIAGVMFGESVAVATALTQGCSPIGPRRRVTEGEDNVVKALDGRSPLEALIEDLAVESGGEAPRQLGGLHVALPAPGSDRADYAVRNLTGIDRDENRGWIAVGMPVEVGQEMMFCRRDPDSARRDLDRMLNDIKGRIAGPPKAGLYFSCLARGPNLFGAPGAELRRIEQALGRFPLAGFFANGEISRDRVYGYTGVLTLFL
jgi:small ligand-binding sensory domain FIST